jgi:mono/diheme cytochrome c family protein
MSIYTVPAIRCRTVVVAIFLLATARLNAADTDFKALALQARTVLKTYCHRCHHGAGSEGGDFDVLRPETLTAPREDDKPYVVAGKPADSYLYQRLAIRKQGKGDMPPKEVRERPEDADKTIIRQWIEAGAPAFPIDNGRKYVSTADVLSAIRDDLRQAATQDVPFRRYFTLTHLHNNPKVPDGDLRVYRAALSKVLNSLSWKQRIVVPRTIDKEQTVFAIDVRDLDWDRHDLWRQVMKAYPYGLKYDKQPNAALQKLDEDIEQLTGCELAFVRADWFAATATRPPLYHELLQLPKHIEELERKLGVDANANFLRDQLLRAGFAVSGVSGQNRLVERHDALYGAYWKSHDFKADNAHGNLPRFPLGPIFRNNPHPDQAFEQDGGEIIFHLPNGLQGYLLIDGKGNRIDEGPIVVVSDALKTSGTPAIVTGVSCMACHKHGMIGFKDQVRDGAAVAGGARQKVQRLYPPQAAMDERVKEDEERFLRALDRAIGPFLRVGADKDKSIKDFAEPVGEIARLYRLVDVDLTIAACELDVEKPDELKSFIAGDRRLRELGLAPLLKEGGAVKRADWERVGATSLMQRVAREIEKGSPFNVTR